MLNCGYLGRKVCAGHLCGPAAWWGQLPGELDAGPLLVCEHSGGHLVTVDEEDKQVPNSSGVHAVFDPICSISVPELPQPLEEWNVVEQVQVQVNRPENTAAVAFIPILLHRSTATRISLSIKVRLG